MGKVKEAAYCETCGNFSTGMLLYNKCDYCEDFISGWNGKTLCPTEDPVVNNVINKFITRSAEGMKKYGLTMRANPLDFMAWAQHAQEEAMDFILYIERLREEYIKERTHGFDTRENVEPNDPRVQGERPGDYL